MIYTEYLVKVKALRQNPMVLAWIARRQAATGRRPVDCGVCTFPHVSDWDCNNSPFGVVRFGGRDYTVSVSNVSYWVSQMETHAPAGAFHWKNERYFKRGDKGIEITFFTDYNNVPEKNVWLIHQEEWNSIVGFLSRQEDKL